MKRFIRYSKFCLILFGFYFLANQSVKIIKNNFLKDKSPLKIVNANIPSILKEDVNSFLWEVHYYEKDINLDGWEFKIILDEKKDWFGELETYNVPILGYCDDNNKIIFFHKKMLTMEEKERKAIVFHEMLHCFFGVNHSFSVDSKGRPIDLMYPKQILTKELLEKHWNVLVSNSFALIKEKPEPINFYNFITDTTMSFNRNSFNIDTINDYKVHINLKSILGALFLLYSLIFTMVYHLEILLKKD